jgi:hypothetical protein
VTDADLSYPIGKFQAPRSVDAVLRARFVADIEAAPGLLREAVSGLDDRQLDTPYRPGGWTVRQVTHHVPDSHLNAYVRFKLALTEDAPLIKGYDQTRWAELPEARTAPVEVSLNLLDAVHARWLRCIRLLPPEAFERTFRHSELGLMTLNTQLALYSWHGRHHTAHITGLRRGSGW